jgi:hypothetical protein
LRGPGGVLDATASQFDSVVPYDRGVRKAFLTKAPSKRAITVISRVLSSERRIDFDAGVRRLLDEG